MISQETIALVKERTDILAIIQEAVPSLKRRGRSFVGLCPFHKEKTGSFHVNPDRGFFHCFGCKESGSAIDFLIKHEGYTFPEAVRALAERAGIAVEESKDSSAFTESDRQKKARDELYAVNALAATFWEEQLRKHEHRSYALDELAKRDLSPEKDADVLQAFRIGYAPSGWDGLAQFLKAQGVSPSAAETVGLLVPRSSGSGYYDRFRHRLMFAVMDPQGRVVAFSGRALADLPAEPAPQEQVSRSALRYIAPKDTGPPPKYINSPESPIYTKGQMLFGIHQARHAVRQAGVAVLVEGNFDVVSLHARKIDNVVGILGTAFTPEQAKLLRRFAPSVVFLLDGDAAGKKAVRLSRDPIRSAGMSARVASLPPGSDPDEVARTRGPQAITDLVKSARGYLEALIEMELDETFNQGDVFERRERVSRVVQILAEEDDPIVHMELRAFAEQAVGARLDLHGLRVGQDDQHATPILAALERTLRQQEADARARGEVPRALQKPSREAEKKRLAPKPPGSELRRAMLAALIEWPQLLADPEVEEALDDLEGPSVTLLVALRRAWNFEQNRLDIDAFLGAVPPSYEGFARQRLADSASESQSAAKDHLLRNAKQLKSLVLSQSAAQNSREMYRAQGDYDAQRDLLKEASEMLRAKQGIKA
ncbi:MAG: toprim domain-containing protein [Labilithrix sp.]|nr:toprim domain-containing protein [Labilithrix sp.]MCW5816517.1 toprim domain-containing protein [Labilithrix sp.]